MLGKVEIDTVRAAARRALGDGVSASDVRHRYSGACEVVVRLSEREAIAFEGRSIQGARRLALRVLEQMGPVRGQSEQASFEGWLSVAEVP